MTSDKTRRGLRGRIEDRKSAGGNSFGYTIVGHDGERGDRVINEAEATVVRRIFESYAAGMSPKRIALRLNSEGIRAPRGGSWSSSTINGNRQRGTGIINNELYVGRMTWNRLSYVRDPETGRRRSRTNPPKDVVVVDVPDLRIVSGPLWEAVRARQAALDGKLRGASVPASQGAPFWTKRRPPTCSPD
jgi:site-specific DNA recombinase